MVEAKKNRKGWVVYVLLILSGLAYYIWVRLTGIAIPCLFHAVTGFRCPGCGVTTMAMCLAGGDWAGAFQANPFLCATLPLIAAQIVYAEVRRNRGKELPGWNRRCLAVYTALLCLFGAARNIW